MIAGTLQVFHQVQLLHCYRETNRAADSLAKTRCAQVECFASFVTPSLSITEALIFDNAHVAASGSPTTKHAGLRPRLF